MIQEQSMVCSVCVCSPFTTRTVCALTWMVLLQRTNCLHMSLLVAYVLFYATYCMRNKQTKNCWLHYIIWLGRKHFMETCFNLHFCYIFNEVSVKMMTYCINCHSHSRGNPRMTICLFPPFYHIF